jgi:RNA polymerase sigma-70 factor (ECF subfamily)
MANAEREDRFSQLVREHGNAVYRYLRRRHGLIDATDAEDLLAEVMTVAWRRLDDIPRDAEAAWLFGVARHHLSNSRRRGVRRARLTAPLRPPAPAPSAEAESIAELELRAALSALTPAEREALTLTAWEGLSPSELAVALGVTVNAAAIRLSKAKAHLQALLGDAESSPVPGTRTLQ